MADRHARAFTAVSAYGTSVALNKTRQRPVSAKVTGSQGKVNIKARFTLDGISESENIYSDTKYCKLPLLTPPPPPPGLYNFGKGFRRACKRVTGRGLGLYSGGLITRTKKQFQYKLEAGLISVGIITVCIFFTGRFSYN